MDDLTMRPMNAVTPVALPAPSETAGQASGPSAFEDSLQNLDNAIWSGFARMTNGASPFALATAMFSWATHSAISPGQNIKTMIDASREFQNALTDAIGAFSEQAGSGPHGHHAAHASSQIYDRMANWIDTSLTPPRGVSPAHARLLAFSARQFLEAFHPDNFLLSNVDAMTETHRQNGVNLLRGWGNLVEDLQSETRKRLLGETPSPPDAVGRTLAVTPGKVVYRNRLFELIQYTPTTESVSAEPILIVPAWILKYYIMDLSQQNSMVRFLVERGHTVFIMSWRNPDADDADLTFDDYRRLGVEAAVEAVQSLVPDAQIHGVGYCLGGTMLSVAAAAMSRHGGNPFQSISLLAAQVDFTEPGQLALFISESQLALLEADMETKGYLDGKQMSGAFALLHSRELVWHKMRDAYLFGNRGNLIDLMVWNSDLTRMPYRMHAEYLKRMFLNNDFVEGRLVVDGAPIAISDIHAPIFALGTTTDHVAPWRSVHKIHLFADTDVTFALTNGGHNAGVVSPPDHPHRRHHIYTKPDLAPYIGPDSWMGVAEARQGSWWLSWADWLGEKSSGRAPARTPKRAPIASNEITAKAKLEAAPGNYVRG